MALGESILGLYFAAPTWMNRIKSKRAMIHFRHTREKAFKMKPGALNQLSAYVGTSWGALEDGKHRSLTGFLIYFGNALISTINFAQKWVTLSFSESDFVALSEARRFLVCLGQGCDELSIT